MKVAIILLSVLATAFAVPHMHYKEDSEYTESQTHKDPRKLNKALYFIALQRNFSFFTIQIVHFSSSAPPEEPPKEEYKPETDSYQPEYEREDSYKNEYEDKPKYGQHGHRNGYGHKDDSYMNEYEDKPKYGHHGYRHGYGHKKSYGKFW